MWNVSSVLKASCTPGRTYRIREDLICFATAPSGSVSASPMHSAHMGFISYAPDILELLFSIWRWVLIRMVLKQRHIALIEWSKPGGTVAAHLHSLLPVSLLQHRVISIDRNSELHPWKEHRDISTSQPIKESPEYGRRTRS